MLSRVTLWVAQARTMLLKLTYILKAMLRLHHETHDNTEVCDQEELFPQVSLERTMFKVEILAQICIWIKYKFKDKNKVYFLSKFDII